MTSIQNKILVITCYCSLLFFIHGCNLGPEEENDLLNWISAAGSDVDTTTYFVAINGDDNADGKTAFSAFRTISKALQSVHPGGLVSISPGNYNESIGMEEFGTDAAPITITGSDSGTILDGQGQLAIAFFCENCTNILFTNLEIKNYTDIGIGGTFSSKITVRNLDVQENGHKVQLKDWELEGYGIHFDESEFIVIENNIVHRNGPDPKIFPDYLMGTGINTYRINNSIIRNNESYNNIGGGILVEDSYEVTVESNEVYGNDLDASADDWWDGGIWVDGGYNIYIRNNIFRDNLGPGIEISDEDLQQPYGYVLENNISTNNYYGIYIWNFGTTSWPDSTILYRYNNQFTGNTHQDVWIVDWGK